jgi:hypothetical protein
MERIGCITFLRSGFHGNAHAACCRAPILARSASVRAPLSIRTTNFESVHHRCLCTSSMSWSISRSRERRRRVVRCCLYLPGLIRAVSSEWQYKKFMSKICAGGKRQYSVSIVLDLSFSLSGYLETFMIESVLTLIASLEDVDWSTSRSSDSERASRCSWAKRCPRS